MPISVDFGERLEKSLPDIIKHFGTPFIIYDEKGIRETQEGLLRAMSGAYGYRNYFAVKAAPDPAVMKIMLDMGCGFDCSSIPELILARRIGAQPEDIMFTSD